MIICDITQANHSDATWTNDFRDFHLNFVDGPYAGVITLSSHFSSTVVNGVGNTQIKDGPTSVPLTLGTDTFALKWDSAAGAPQLVMTTATPAPHSSPGPSSLLLAILGEVTPFAFGWRKLFSAA